jgi:hypothetical protein
MIVIYALCNMCRQGADLEPDQVLLNPTDHGTSVMFTCAHCGAFVEFFADPKICQMLTRAGVLTVSEAAEWIVADLENEDK